MVWSRRWFDQWEWYHRPVSPMEETLLLPEHINQTTNLISRRLGIKFPPPQETWKVIDGYLYLSNQYPRLWLQSPTLLLPFRFWRELGQVKNRWTDEVLPNYQKEMNQFKQVDWSDLNTKDLLDLIEKIVKREGEFLAEAVYVVIYALTTEVVLKLAYKYWVKDRNPLNYNELLIGYPDEGIKAEVELWKIAQSNRTNQEKALAEWISQFGHRIQDKDILYPTLGEQPQLIQAYLKMYQAAANPEERIKVAVARRQARERFVEKHLLWFPPFEFLFHKIKLLAQDYARIRNSRPFYYQGNYLIRQILLTLGQQLRWNDDQIFFITIEELKQAIRSGSNRELEQKIQQRRELYEQRLAQVPALEVEI